MTVFFFGDLRHEPIRLDAKVGFPELVTALTGTGLTISNNPNGGFVIHRLRKGDRYWTSPHLPPEPPRAA